MLKRLVTNQTLIISHFCVLTIFAWQMHRQAEHRQHLIGEAKKAYIAKLAAEKAGSSAGTYGLDLREDCVNAHRSRYRPRGPKIRFGEAGRVVGTGLIGSTCIEHPGPYVDKRSTLFWLMYKVPQDHASPNLSGMTTGASLFSSAPAKRPLHQTHKLQE
jgi:hypothetical protein